MFCGKDDISVNCIQLLMLIETFSMLNREVRNTSVYKKINTAGFQYENIQISRQLCQLKIGKTFVSWR